LLIPEILLTCALPLYQHFLLLRGLFTIIGTFVSSYIIALPGTRRQAFNEAKTQSSEYTQKNGSQVFGKYIHDLHVFKSTPGTRSFKQS